MFHLASVELATFPPSTVEAIKVLHLESWPGPLTLIAEIRSAIEPGLLNAWPWAKFGYQTQLSKDVLAQIFSLGMLFQ